jgi:hypothetical protein
VFSDGLNTRDFGKGIQHSGVDIGIMNHHEALWMRKGSKAKFCIQSVSVSRYKEHCPQSLQLRMCQDGTHEQFGYTSAAMLWHDENVAKIGKGRKIGNNSGEADLAVSKVSPKAQGVLD